MEVSTFTCSICGEISQRICIYCTKDACSNHLCERCHRCSDCCECDTLFESQNHIEAVNGTSNPASGPPETLILSDD